LRDQTGDLDSEGITQLKARLRSQCLTTSNQGREKKGPSFKRSTNCPDRAGGLEYKFNWDDVAGRHRRKTMSVGKKAKNTAKSFAQLG